MNLLFTICGRAGSKGVKGKNLREFCGVPLVWYTLAAISIYKERCLSPSDRLETVLSTDSEELAELAARVPEPPVFLRRTPDLAGDRVAKVAVIRDCLLRAGERCGAHFDAVVDLDITSPLRTVRDVQAAVSRKIKRPETDVVYSVAPARRNPYFNMVREENGFFVKAIPSDFTARQQAPVFYDMNASIYAYNARSLLEKDAATYFNDGADAVVMLDTGILDIDSEEDYELMQVIAGYLFHQRPEFQEVREKALSWLKAADSAI